MAAAALASPVSRASRMRVALTVSPCHSTERVTCSTAPCAAQASRRVSTVPAARRPKRKSFPQESTCARSSWKSISTKRSAGQLTTSAKSIMTTACTPQLSRMHSLSSTVVRYRTGPPSTSIGSLRKVNTTGRKPLSTARRITARWPMCRPSKAPSATAVFCPAKYSFISFMDWITCIAYPLSELSFLFIRLQRILRSAAHPV